MTNFTIKDSMVRVDRFKQRGKWYETLEVDMAGHYDTASIHDSLRQCIKEQYPGLADSEMLFVCLEPHHKFAHPIMLQGLTK